MTILHPTLDILPGCWPHILTLGRSPLIFSFPSLLGSGGGGGKNENGWNLKIDFDKRKWLNRYWYMNFKEEMQITRDIAKESYRLL